MSAKRGMSKQQRLYYEHINKEKWLREIAEYYQQLKEIESKQHNSINYKNLL